MKTISGAGHIHHSNGFTLIELMIAVVIVGILAAIAYPNYTAYVERGKRSEGRALLLEAANLMERYYSNCNKYPRLTVAITGGSSSCANFGTIDLPTESENGYYELNLIRTLAAIVQTNRCLDYRRNLQVGLTPPVLS